MACFEQNLHTWISGGDSVLSTTFCGDHVVDTTFLFYDHYDITIRNYVARDVHCDIIVCLDVMGTDDVTMHTDVGRTLIYYILLPTYDISVFLVKSLKLYIKH